MKNYENIACVTSNVGQEELGNLYKLTCIIGVSCLYSSFMAHDFPKAKSNFAVFDLHLSPSLGINFRLISSTMS